jgi:hypothetical protein
LQERKSASPTGRFPATLKVLQFVQLRLRERAKLALWQKIIRELAKIALHSY